MKFCNVAPSCELYVRPAAVSFMFAEKLPGNIGVHHGDEEGGVGYMVVDEPFFERAEQYAGHSAAYGRPKYGSWYHDSLLLSAWYLNYIDSFQIFKVNLQNFTL